MNLYMKLSLKAIIDNTTLKRYNENNNQRWSLKAIIDNTTLKQY